ncbi:2-amino-4-hydroxy-6-hydroxymethyldihydropteridine diphosphokinase [Maribacter halichondriae]|uniref:2-amino-4-hydroxy-6- hydroxymethyldihydropteridine diphosphokinase n=1 Tax=Maribacter halichondriae TaxID=2980554 RepID=UPI0023587361|nr:2-amino-4-hydroxy-6-hydroxymethyldihydropteridine diphosphokinase [Maribacter sp. Hal144]
MSPINTVYFSLGSNLGNRLEHLQQSIFLLGKHIGKVKELSKIYQTASWGFKGDDFLNMCVCLETQMDASEVLDRILDIEKKMGRDRTGSASSYVSRNVDIDVIFFNRDVTDSDTLTVPHKKIQERRFVLRPLADIAPQFYHPILKKDIRNLLQECKDTSAIDKTELRLFKSREALFSKMEFIAIEGNIGAGKTSLAQKIAIDFNAKLVLERFADNPFLPNFYQDQARYAFPLEMSFLADRYQQFSDDTSQYDLFKNFMVSDYDIFKSLIFAKVTLQKDEFILYRKIFDFMYKEVKKPRIYVFLYQTTERLLENIKKRGRDYEQDIKPDYLEKINRGYFDYIKGFPELNSLVIDISNRDFLSSQDDYEYILIAIQNYALAQLN